MNTPALVNGRPDSPYYNNQLDAVTRDNGDGTYSLSIIGNIMAVPTLQQVTEAGNTTNQPIQCNTLILSDSTNIAGIAAASTNGKVQFSAGAKVFLIDWKNLTDGVPCLVQVKDNNAGGSLMTNNNIKLTTLPADPIGIGDNTVDIPHGLGIAPDQVMVGARDGDAMNAIKAGYWTSWDATNVKLHLVTPSTIAAAGAAFTLTLFIDPA